MFYYQINEFQHVKYSFFEDGSSYISCSCQTFNIANGYTDDFPPTSNCCHCRLMKDIIEQTKNDHLNLEKIALGKLQISTPVISLPSKHDTEKFSVVGSDSSISFVSIYKTNHRPMIQCHTGRCQMRYGKMRKITLLSSDNICVHLKEVCKFKEINENGDNNDDDNDDEDTEFMNFRIPEEKVRLFYNSLEIFFDVFVLEVYSKFSLKLFIFYSGRAYSMRKVVYGNLIKNRQVKKLCRQIDLRKI